jgi:hypothetical protein
VSSTASPGAGEYSGCVQTPTAAASGQLQDTAKANSGTGLRHGLTSAARKTAQALGSAAGAANASHRHNPLLKLRVLIPNSALFEKLKVRAIVGVAAEGDVNHM